MPPVPQLPYPFVYMLFNVIVDIPVGKENISPMVKLGCVVALLSSANENVVDPSKSPKPDALLSMALLVRFWAERLVAVPTRCIKTNKIETNNLDWSNVFFISIEGIKVATIYKRCFPFTENNA